MGIVVLCYFIFNPDGLGEPWYVVAGRLGMGILGALFVLAIRRSSDAIHEVMDAVGQDAQDGHRREGQ